MKRCQKETILILYVFGVDSIKDVIVSILMPVKNADSYLAECLDSIIGQSLIQWELIAIDNYSTDDSLSILRAYQDKDERITVHANTGADGIIEALRLAYAQSRGEYVTRMDADDIMAKDKLLSMYTALAMKGKTHVAVGLVSYFSNEGLGDGYRRYETWLNCLTTRGKNFDEIYTECVIPSPNWMMHRSDLESCGAFDSSWYPEDYDLSFRMLEAGLTVLPIHKVTHHWRDYAHRASRTNPEYRDNQFISLNIKYFKKLHWDANKTVTLWGAGNKGKSIARVLLKQQIPFIWITNNTKKIGQDIYGQKIRSQKELVTMRNLQLISALSSPGDKEFALQIVMNNSWDYNIDYFPFC